MLENGAPFVDTQEFVRVRIDNFYLCNFFTYT